MLLFDVGFIVSVHLMFGIYYVFGIYLLEL